MKFGLTAEQLDSIKMIFSLHSNIDKVMLFGSRAKGNFHSGSDIDLALIGESLNLDELFQIEVELESLSFPVKFDLVIYNRLSDAEVIEHIARVGKEIYKVTDEKVEHNNKCD